MAASAAMSVGAESKSSRGIAWSGVAGAVLLIAAAFISFWFPPQISGSDAAQEIESFYADSTQRSLFLTLEPLGILGGAFLLWFAGHLRARLGSKDDRYAAVAFGGVTAFSVLAIASFMAQSTIAGTVAFTDAFVLDPHVAMVFSHLAYVLLMGAAAAAGVTLFAAARAAEGRSRTARYVLASLCIVGVAFVYLPVIAFLVWSATVSWGRATQI